MFSFGAFGGALGFINPWLLAALIALPILWWLLRAIPPSPKLEIFAGVRLLFGLEDPEREASKTPWWLLLLRVLALAAVIIGFAGPVLNPSTRLGPAGDGPVLILMDQGWASAPDWALRKAAALAAVVEAEQAGRPVIFWQAASGAVPGALPAQAVRAVLEAARPAPWPPDHAAVLVAIEAGETPDPAQTIWFHDGLGHDEATARLAARLAEFGPLRLIGPATTARALTPPRLADGQMVTDVLRAGSGPATVPVIAFSASPGEPERRLGQANASFGAGGVSATATFDLPAELLDRVSRIAVAEGPSAGGAALADAGIRRITAAIVGPQAETVVASLTSASHYLHQALVPWAEVREAALGDVLADPPAAIILADQGDLTETERSTLAEWVEAGGLLIRFAGPRLAAAVGEGSFGAGAATAAEDKLLPVRLRRGGRVLGGALAWGAPKALGPFDPAGPFRRLTAPDDVDVRTQVLAEPSPDLAGKVWATLEDGTPLVTAKRLGQGHVVLFHVSADAEWSSLPLSGLFVEMLGGLMALAPGRAPDPPTVEELAGTLWRGVLMIGVDGVPVPASDLGEPVTGELLGQGKP
ncbi:MAG TPA: BatA domain-containing protein, partial [Devosiaceae bacterium]|nr:BatA domain-containing protein [Devosiaceae bacterium]